MEGSDTPVPTGNESADYCPSFITGRFIVWYQRWKLLLRVLALFSILITALQFAFMDLIPEDKRDKRLLILESVEILPLLDMFVQVCATFIDMPRNAKWWVLLIDHLLNITACFPWFYFYMVHGNKEAVRWFLLLRMLRLKTVHQLFSMGDCRIGFISTRAIKMLAIKFIAFHLGACAYFYTAIVMPVDKQGKTWLGTLTPKFRKSGFWLNYLTSLYFAAITISTIGYGDFHPVLVLEMMIAIIMSMSLSSLDNYMNNFNKQPQELTKPLEPLAIRLQKTRDLHKPCIKDVPLFKDCTEQFINEIASRVHQEEFKGGQFVVEKGYILQHIYFISSGQLETRSDPSPEPVGVDIIHSQQLTRPQSIGEISVLHDMPNPCDVKVLQPSTLLRLDKETLKKFMSIYANDGMRVLFNLSEVIRRDVEESTESLQEFEPLGIRLQKHSDLHRPCIQDVPLFEGCTEQFINEIASRVHQEQYNEGQLVVKKGYMLDNMYFISSGELEMLLDAESTGPEIVEYQLFRPQSIGEHSVLHNVRHSCDVKVVRPSTLLRLEKHILKDIMSNYVDDSLIVSNNVPKVRSPEELRKDESMRAAKINTLVSNNDIESILKEPDVNLQDYRGSTALHVAASLGLEKMTWILIEQKGGNFDVCDKSGKSPLQLAIEEKHEAVIDLLIKKGAKLMIEDQGRFLCDAVATDDVAYVERLLACGLDADSQDKDKLTPLHVAARRGCYRMVRLLINYGATQRVDRWGVYPYNAVPLSCPDLMHELDEFIAKEELDADEDNVNEVGGAKMDILQT